MVKIKSWYRWTDLKQKYDVNHKNYKLLDNYTSLLYKEFTRKSRKNSYRMSNLYT